MLVGVVVLAIAVATVAIIIALLARSMLKAMFAQQRELLDRIQAPHVAAQTAGARMSIDRPRAEPRTFGRTAGGGLRVPVKEPEVVE